MDEIIQSLAKNKHPASVFPLGDGAIALLASELLIGISNEARRLQP
jgi:hypothetical protein